MAHSESDASSIASNTSSGGLSLNRTTATLAPPAIEFEIDAVSTTSSTSDASSGGLSTSDGTASTGSGGLSVNGTVARGAHPGGDGTTLMELFAVQLEVCWIFPNSFCTISIIVRRRIHLFKIVCSLDGTNTIHKSSYLNDWTYILGEMKPTTCKCCWKQIIDYSVPWLRR